MCMLVDCGSCGKKTWKGCGKHVEQIFKDVADADKCKCAEKADAADKEKK